MFFTDYRIPHPKHSAQYMILNFYKYILLTLLLSTTLADNLYATHAMGADLTYNCIGNNQYRVKLQFYRDCNGINADSIETISVSAPGCASFTLNLPLISVTEITPSCPGLVGTACNGGNGQFGIQRFVYEGTVSLPATCSIWTLGWQLCCRNNAISTLTSPGTNEMYISSIINTGLSACNNSPSFLNSPTPFACINQAVFYNHGAVDQDGDDLRYSLTSCKRAAGSSVTYNNQLGISAQNPLISSNGININANTGAISFTPTALQIGVVCVLVEEFRNGVKIGEVIRDIQFTVVNCLNQAPSLSGINGSNSFDTTINIGQQLCFTIFSSDPNQGQLLTLSYNNAIPSASFSSNSNPFPSGTFCWTASPADTGLNTFTVQVADNYCPIVGQNTYTYSIYVNPASPPAPCAINVSLVSFGDLRCSNSDGTAQITASGGTAPYSFTVINNSNGLIYSNNSGIFNTLTAGNYSVVVSDSNSCQPNCSNLSFQIGGSATTLTHTAQGSVNLCPAPNTFGGIITLTANGGTAPYLYSVGNGFSSSNIFNGLASGTYQTIVMDANGCYSNQTVNITSPNPLTAAIINVIQPACGRRNGRFTITPIGGTAPYQYQVNNILYTSNVITNLGGGTYNVIVRDANNCTFNTTIQLNGNPVFVVTATTTSASCNGTCNGTATASSNVPATFVWSNGQSGATITNLCRGNYSVTATDNFGCTRVSRVTVREPARLTVRTLATTNETCAGSDASISIQAAGGTAPYNFTLTNSTGNTFTNTNGIFNGLTAGQYSYSVSDANNCLSQIIRIRIRRICQNNGINVLSGLKENYIGLSPNPASTVVKISFSTSSLEPVSISIIDNNGKVVLDKYIEQGEGEFDLDISNWAASTYIVMLRNQKGEILETSRMVTIK